MGKKMKLLTIITIINGSISFTDEKDVITKMLKRHRKASRVTLFLFFCFIYLFIFSF